MKLHRRCDPMASNMEIEIETALRGGTWEREPYETIANLESERVRPFAVPLMVSDSDMRLSAVSPLGLSSS